MSESEEVRNAHGGDGPPDELEPGELIEAELSRLAHHPRAEAARLKKIAADGEHGSAPFIELVLVARRIVPLVALVVGIMLLIYYKA